MFEVEKGERGRGSQRKRNPFVAENGDGLHEAFNAGHVKTLQGARDLYVPSEIGVEVREDGEDRKSAERDEIDDLGAAQAMRGETTQQRTLRGMRVGNDLVLLFNVGLNNSPPSANDAAAARTLS